MKSLGGGNVCLTPWQHLRILRVFNLYVTQIHSPFSATFLTNSIYEIQNLLKIPGPQLGIVCTVFRTSTDSTNLERNCKSKHTYR